MIDHGPAPQILDGDQIIDKFGDNLSRVIRESIDAEVEPERIWALRQAQKADFYWRGLQYIAPEMTDTGIGNFSAIGAPQLNQNDQSDYYDYIQNIYRGYGRAFISALGQRIPNAPAVPDDPNDDECLHSTDLANRCAIILRSQWQLELQMLELSLHLWKSSTVFIYTPWVADGAKYGQTGQPVMEPRSVKLGQDIAACSECGTETPEQESQPISACPSCGSTMLQHKPAESTEIPEVIGTQQYDNGQVEFHLCTIMTIACPFFKKNLEELNWLRYEYDASKWDLMEQYGDKLKRIKNKGDGTAPQTAAGQTASLIRDSAASPLGVPTQHRGTRWNYQRLWWRPALYNACPDEVRDALRQSFPKGLKITLVQDQIVDLEEEDLRDVWSIVKPDTSEYIWADPMGLDMMPAQDLKNDTLSIAYQTLEGGTPLMFADPRVLDVEWLNANRAQPNQILPVLQQFGSRLEDSFFATSPSVFSEQMLPWMAQVENDARVIVGTTEAIYGGVAGDDQTAHEAELRKNAAMQKIATNFVYIRHGIARAYQNGVKQLAKYGTGTLRMVKKKERGFENLVVNLSELGEGGWHFESDEGFPMTRAEQRAYLLWILANQEMAQEQGFTDPRNIRKNHQLLGFTGYHAPDEDVWDKASDVIARLLKESPIMQPGPDGNTQPQPSIPIDEFDDHGKMAVCAYSWAISDEGRRLQQQQQGQNAGFANVVAWGKAHYQAANPPATPPPPQIKGNVSIALDKVAETMGPEAAQAILQDFNLVPGAPPPAPAPQGSAPAQKGKAPTAALPPPPNTPGAMPGGGPPTVH